MTNSIWITWERHRRSDELAKAFGAELFTITSSRNIAIRYLVLLLKTVHILFKHKPDYLFVQNPSLVLATLASLLRPIFGYKLIVDRHTNFRLWTLNSRSIKWKFFHILSRYTTKSANYTIVTNEALRVLVNDWGGHGLILQDKIPNITVTEKDQLKGKYNIVFVSTYSADEPVMNVVNAFSRVSSDIYVYITGNYNNFPQLRELQKQLPDNVILTGFLPDKEYIKLLNSVDALMVLTTVDHLLTCGAYEAVALHKPMILSATDAIQDYFYKGAIYTHPDSNSINASIIQLIEKHNSLYDEVIDLHDELITAWDQRFESIIDKVYG